MPGTTITVSDAGKYTIDPPVVVWLNGSHWLCMDQQVGIINKWERDTPADQIVRDVQRAVGSYLDAGGEGAEGRVKSTEDQ